MGFVVLGQSQQIPEPSLEWQRAFGGGRDDNLVGVVSAGTAGYLLGGYSSSTNGTKSSPDFGAQDYWALLIDTAGEPVWEHSFGGSRLDFLRSLVWTSDQGALLAGYSNSEISGNKTSPFLGGGLFNLGDFWVVRLNGNGTKAWEQTYGGADDDVLFAAAEKQGGGFLLGGYSMSMPGGTKTSTNFGMNDFWMVSTDADGVLLWDKSYGGSSFDHCYGLALTSDGGCVLAGFSLSPADGNKESAPLGNEDMWIIRLDASGEKVWEKVFGGDGSDVANDIQPTVDGGFVVAGYSSSGMSDHKSSPNYGSADYWVVRLAGDGTKLWDRSFGGTGDDQAQQVRRTPDGGFIVAGYSYSPADGNKTSSNRSTNVFNGDYWVVRLDEDGNKLWEQTYGGQRNDEGYSVDLASDGGYIVGGKSLSDISGNKTVPAFGLEDYWVIKLGPDGLTRPPVLHLVSQSGDDIAAMGYRFILQGLSNHTYRTEYTLDFQGWTPVSTNLVSGESESVEIIDPGADPSTGRYYRAVLMPVVP